MPPPLRYGVVQPIRSARLSGRAGCSQPGGVILILAPGVEVALTGPDAGAYPTRLSEALAGARTAMSRTAQQRLPTVPFCHRSGLLIETGEQEEAALRAAYALDPAGGVRGRPAAVVRDELDPAAAESGWWARTRVV
ncbi:hypothetical protein J0910_30665 [Nocardiopsis sp. CNT-189]|uniref:hypothetical protein n=1 Tax=Nocardiopsis oceanisediminis TaxID=2816862 RepID=UPI003B2C335E